MPNDKWKVRWDAWMAGLILVSSFYIPYRLAFIEQVSLGCVIIEVISDLFFLADMVVTFFAAFYDS